MAPFSLSLSSSLALTRAQRLVPLVGFQWDRRDRVGVPLKPRAERGGLVGGPSWDGSAGGLTYRQLGRSLIETEGSSGSWS